jgi:hypothetical protein
MRVPEKTKPAVLAMQRKPPVVCAVLAGFVTRPQAQGKSAQWQV